MQKIAAFVATGNLNLAAVLLSLTMLILSLCLRYLLRVDKIRRSESEDEKRQLVSLSFAFMHLVVSIAACCLSWLEVRSSGSWKLPILLTYVVFLGVWRLSYGTHSLKRHICRHINAMTVVVLALRVDDTCCCARLPTRFGNG